VVKLQTERGHRVVSTGPYAWVRHPMYTGTILFFVGAPLLLGSWWGVAMAPLFVVLFAIRTRIEERAADRGLPEYADYTAQVRYRCCPGSGEDRTSYKMAYSADDSHSRSGPMPHVKIYTGGCHCGLVRFRVHHDLAMVTSATARSAPRRGCISHSWRRRVFSCAPARTI